MKLTFLGTGAADWSFAEDAGVVGYRRNSSLLIDECLLIDPGPDVPNALSTFGKDAESVRYIINTHKHPDHFNEQTVAALAKAEMIELSAAEVRTVGKYTVSALEANHPTCAGTVHFIISDGEKKIFYGLDGAWLTYSEVQEIKKGVDLAVLDATIGDVPGDHRIFEHNNLNMVKEIKATLSNYVKKFVISHMAKTLHSSHETLQEKMKAQGIEVAFDGFELYL